MMLANDFAEVSHLAMNHLLPIWSRRRVESCECDQREGQENNGVKRSLAIEICLLLPLLRPKNGSVTVS